MVDNTVKILLIAPSIKQSISWRLPDGIPRSLSRNFGVSPWLGICYIAGYLGASGFDSNIIDMDVERLSIAQVCKRIHKIKPSLIGISTISFTFLYALRLAEEIKKHFDIPVIFGGPHVSIYPREIIQHGCIDVGVIGEAEETFLEIVKTFQGSNGHADSFYRGLGKVKGIIFKLNNEVIITEPRDFIKDIDCLPFPAIEKLPLHRYSGNNYIKPYISMVTVRGCKFNCSFCSKEPWGNNFRFHSARRVVDEIEYYVNNLGIRSIEFFDDTFTAIRPRVLEIVHLIRKRNIKFDFGILTRVDCIDKELLIGLKTAGCKVITYGIEFGNENIQLKVNKRLSIEMIKDAFRLTKEAGITAVGFFMIGHPEETEEDIANTIGLMKQTGADYVKTNILVPFPGSQLYKQLLSSGKLKVDFWAELTKGNNLPLEMLINTRVSIPRLVRLRNYMNRFSYFSPRRDPFKFHNIKSYQDIKRTLGMLIGTYFDTKI